MTEGEAGRGTRCQSIYSPTTKTCASTKHAQRALYRHVTILETRGSPLSQAVENLLFKPTTNVEELAFFDIRRGDCVKVSEDVARVRSL